MSFSATGAHRPLQSKPKANPFQKRASAFSSHPRRKSTAPAEPSAKRQRLSSSPESERDCRLPTGTLIRALAPKSSDVLSLVSRARDSMFGPIPARSAGMSSTRIAEVLNFRLRLAPLVSMEHIYALSVSRTATDREIASLVANGAVRRLVIVGRGRSGARVGDCIVKMEDWVRLVEASGLPDGTKTKYLLLLRTKGAAVDAREFEADEVSLLVSKGFMTATSALANGIEVVSRSGAFSLGSGITVANAGTSAPTGSHEAVGGKSALHLRGGGSGALPNGKDANHSSGSLTFALPGTGAYLRLVSEARVHLTHLLVKASPKYKESLKDMLRERWDGSIPADDVVSRSKRARGEWVGVLPGKTKKWKTFYGIEFDWILEECLGSGLVECFDTGSVGLGVRAV